MKQKFQPVKIETLFELDHQVRAHNETRNVQAQLRERLGVQQGIVSLRLELQSDGCYPCTPLDYSTRIVGISIAGNQHEATAMTEGELMQNEKLSELANAIDENSDIGLLMPAHQAETTLQLDLAVDLVERSMPIVYQEQSQHFMLIHPDGTMEQGEVPCELKAKVDFFQKSVGGHFDYFNSEAYDLPGVEVVIADDFHGLEVNVPASILLRVQGNCLHGMVLLLLGEFPPE